MDELSMSYEQFPEIQNILFFKDKYGKKQIFHNGWGSLISSPLSSIFLHKWACYICSKDIVANPQTFLYQDPQHDKISKIYSPTPLEEIVASLSFPCIVKPVKWSLAKNVSICNSRDDIEKACITIFSDNKKYYPYVLIQQYIEILHEYRVIVRNGKIILAYEKVKEEIKNTQKIFQHNSVAKFLEENDTLLLLQNFVDTLHTDFEISYGGLDIVIDSSEKMRLIEINSKPQLGDFVKHNGDKEVVQMYKSILQSFVS